MKCKYAVIDIQTWIMRQQNRYRVEGNFHPHSLRMAEANQATNIREET